MVTKGHRGPVGHELTTWEWAQVDHMRAHKGEVVSLHSASTFPTWAFSGGAFPDDTIKMWKYGVGQEDQSSRSATGGQEDDSSRAQAGSGSPRTRPWTGRGDSDTGAGGGGAGTWFCCERTVLGGGQSFAVGALASMRYGGAYGIAEACRLFSGDDAGQLRSWDVETGACIATAPAHSLALKSLVAADGLVVTG